MSRPWIALLLALTGCGGGPQCPLVGCSSLLAIELPAGTSAATACVDGVCSSQVVDGVVSVPLTRKDEGAEAMATVTVAGREYAGTVPLTRTSPVGPECPAKCVTGRGRLDEAAGVVVAVDGS